MGGGKGCIYASAGVAGTLCGLTGVFSSRPDSPSFQGPKLFRVFLVRVLPTAGSPEPELLIKAQVEFRDDRILSQMVLQMRSRSSWILVRRG